MVDDVVDRFRVVVEGRHRRNDLHAHPGERQHVLQVDLAQRGFPGDQHQLAALFERHVGGSADETVGVGLLDHLRVVGGEAGEHDHADDRDREL